MYFYVFYVELCIMHFMSESWKSGVLFWVKLNQHSHQAECCSLHMSTFVTWHWQISHRPFQTTPKQWIHFQLTIVGLTEMIHLNSDDVPQSMSIAVTLLQLLPKLFSPNRSRRFICPSPSDASPAKEIQNLGPAKDNIIMMLQFWYAPSYANDQVRQRFIQSETCHWVSPSNHTCQDTNGIFQPPTNWLLHEEHFAPDRQSK